MFLVIIKPEEYLSIQLNTFHFELMMWYTQCQDTSLSSLSSCNQFGWFMEMEGETFYENFFHHSLWGTFIASKSLLGNHTKILDEFIFPSTPSYLFLGKLYLDIQDSVTNGFTTRENWYIRVSIYADLWTGQL